MYYKWTVANGAYSIKNSIPVTFTQAKPVNLESGIEAKLVRNEFAQARAVIDYIKSL
jgi:hypothetical protein